MSASSPFTVNGFSSSAIVQVIFFNGAGSATNSVVPVDITNSSVSITPTSAVNKILITASLYMIVGEILGQATQGFFQCVRGVTVLGGTPYAKFGGTPAANGLATYGSLGFTFMDAPATAAPVTYKFQHYGSANAPTITTANLNIILMEVVA